MDPTWGFQRVFERAEKWVASMELRWESLWVDA